MIALLLVGCDGPPAGIPDTPGPIDVEVLPDLISIATPDLPFLLWLTPSQLASEDWRECPKVYLRDDGVTAIADDCTDSSGVRWYGSVSLSAADGRESVSFTEFGADNGIGGWVADGTLSAERTPSGTGYLIDTNVALVSLANEQSTLFWSNTESAYASYDSLWYADRHDGTIGKQDWGTAEVTTRRAPLAFVYDCGWAAHISGTMTVKGSNTAVVDFYEGALDVAAGPPADTGGGDTGGDSGADTADTGGDDTGRPEFDADDAPDGACGTCRQATISDTPIDECMDLNRSFAWPFPPPF